MPFLAPIANGGVVTPPPAPPPPPPVAAPPPPVSSELPLPGGAGQIGGTFVPSTPAPPPPVSSELPLPGGAGQIGGTFFPTSPAAPPPTLEPGAPPPITSELPLPGGAGQIGGTFSDGSSPPDVSSELPLPGGVGQIPGVFTPLPGDDGSGGAGGTGGGVGGTDDLDAAAAIANANRPDLSNLPPFELLNPFDTRTLASANPTLKGGGALSAIAQACSDYGVDALAAIADALHEGAGGGIGDGGLAYGPFQDHLTEYADRPFYGKGSNNPVVNAWAWSENGIRYSVRAMVNGSPSAKGLRGHPAVYAIVYGYERPADEAGAYKTRAAEYDHLVKLGSGWAQYAAPLFNGPAAGGGVDTTPIAPPASSTYTPAGVVSQWRSFVDVFRTTVPNKRNQVSSLASGLKEVFR